MLYASEIAENILLLEQDFRKAFPPWIKHSRQGNLAIQVDKVGSCPCTYFCWTIWSYIHFWNCEYLNSLRILINVASYLEQRLISCSNEMFLGSTTLWLAIHSYLISFQVKDRTVIQTTDSETRALSPSGLQEKIDNLTSTMSKARSFVRWAFTELLHISASDDISYQIFYYQVDS